MDEKISGQKAIIVEGLQEDLLMDSWNTMKMLKNVPLLLKHGLV